MSCFNLLCPLLIPPSRYLSFSSLPIFDHFILLRSLRFWRGNFIRGHPSNLIQCTHLEHHIYSNLPQRPPEHEHMVPISAIFPSHNIFSLVTVLYFCFWMLHYRYFLVVSLSEIKYINKRSAETIQNFVWLQKRIRTKVRADKEYNVKKV